MTKQSFTTPASTGWRKSGGGGSGASAKWGTSTTNDYGGDLKISNWKEESGPNWYAKSGGGTKASTSGEYVDADGNKVTYTKVWLCPVGTINCPSGCQHVTLTEKILSHSPNQSLTQ